MIEKLVDYTILHHQHQQNMSVKPSSNQEGESSNDSTFPSLVIGNGTCQHIIQPQSQGRKAEKCGRHCTFRLQVYCVVHIEGRVSTKNRLQVFVYGQPQDGQYLTVDKHIIIDENYVICGALIGVEAKSADRVQAEKKVVPSEIPQEDLDWCAEMGLVYQNLVKSAGKR